MNVYNWQNAHLTLNNDKLQNDNKSSLGIDSGELEIRIGI
jgi:hypothetical protein